MRRWLSALAFWFKLRNLQDLPKTFLVRQAMRGFQRGHRVRGGMRCCLMRCCCLWVWIGFVLVAMRSFSLAFLGAFRVLELVSPSRTKAGGLLVTDVRLTWEVLECLVHRSKTDQIGKGMSVSSHKLRGCPCVQSLWFGNIWRCAPMDKVRWCISTNIFIDVSVCASV